MTRVARLMCALAAPIAALDGVRDDEHFRAVKRAAFALRHLASEVGPEVYLPLAERLAERHGLSPSVLTAVLLPHAIAGLDDALRRKVDRAADTADLAAETFDALARAGMPQHLRDLKLSLDDIQREVGTDEALARWVGRRPTREITRTSWGAQSGAIEGAGDVVVALHGRYATAEGAIAHVRHALGHDDEIAVIAPQAAGALWLTARYKDARAADVEDALVHVEGALERAAAHGARVHLFGFSQGACLALAAARASAIKVETLTAIAGADYPSRPRGAFAGRALLSVADDDPFIDPRDVDATRARLEDEGASVTFLERPGRAHAVCARDREHLRQLIAPREGPRGFGGHHEVELLPGALPALQNAPRRGPFGLFSEQVSGTGFVAPRADNHRAWTYRVRPSAQHGPFVGRSHNLDAPLESPLVNLWASDGQERDDDVDFVDGLVRLGGAGDPALRRGYAISQSAFNLPMEDRTFTNADAHMLILPERGALSIFTELGTLDAAPGDVVVVPRGLRISVHPSSREARAYVAESFGAAFKIPERGVVGANGLVDERHFQGPRPFYEDRLAPGTRVSVKMGDALYEAQQDHSPFDVVAWHGSLAPYVYPLAAFVPVGNTRVDHGDPSVYTVLSAALDEEGAHALDLVVFPPRWDPTEHTFRPPYLHRNVTTEINGIVRTGPHPHFKPGMLFVTPPTTAHAVMASSIDAHLALDDNVADRPRRTSADSLWFQFESALPFRPSTSTRVRSRVRADWPSAFGRVASRFDPFSP